MAAILPYFDTDREGIETALKTIGLKAPEAAKVVHIKNTLYMEIMSISRVLADENQDLCVSGGTLHWPFLV